MIHIARTQKDLDQYLKAKTIGLSPTMGNLHQGHLELLRRSLEENELSIISIFVNPTQFAANEDLSSYPRTWEEDVAKITKLSQQYQKDVIIFFPENDEVIYPHGKQTTYSHQRLRAQLEGEVRPTHFDGVTTVCKRLFEMTKATNAYFGKKDYQQLTIIKEMVIDLNLRVNIHSIEIFREASGLAMSSRNNYLSDSDKKVALTLRKTLLQLASTLKQQGLSACREQRDKAIKNKQFNYISIRDALTMDEISSFEQDVVILGNFQVGSTRLLDNIVVEHTA